MNNENYCDIFFESLVYTTNIFTSYFRVYKLRKKQDRIYEQC